LALAFPGGRRFSVALTGGHAAFAIDESGFFPLFPSDMRSRFENTFVAWSVPPSAMDELWAGAWWFLGTTFFRQCILPWNGRMEPLLHLRVRLDQVALSPSQSRVLRKNRDLRVEIRPARIGTAQRDLFHRHKQRFIDGVPESLDDFLGPAPEAHPVPILEFALFEHNRLVAASYLALGQTAVASLYGIFDPDDAHRSLGTLTLLLELEYARQQGHRFYYPGYTLENPSPMDYKKRLFGLEAYEWNQSWSPFARQVEFKAPPRAPLPPSPRFTRPTRRRNPVGNESLKPDTAP
jgi:arginine-tRNA-protein transferase